jgi:arylsulfatase A-like enzyme
MNTKISVILSGMALLASQGSYAQVEKKDKPKCPNIIYVFPDQFRNCALGFWNQEGFKEYVQFKGDPVHTPNLNAFARQSLVLTSAMSNFPLSSPHRGMLFTGMYPNKSGVPLNCISNRPVSSLREDAECIGDVMSHAGYECAYIGKLHLDFPTPNDPENPGQYVEARRPAWDAYTPASKRHGFNYWYSYGTFDEHKNPHYWDTEGKKHEPKEWSPIHEAKKVAEYLKNANKERDADKPFFIMVGMNPPHSPYRSLNDCMEEDFNWYKDKPLDSLLIRPNASLTMKKAESARYYFASVTGIDRAFGMILSALKENGLDKNTIVIFASDHGETMCSQNVEDAKNSPYTEAMNIPFIVRYPGRIQPRVDNLLLSSPDIMPTLLGLCGLDKKIPKEVQGHDYAPLFFNKNAKVKRPDAALYIQNLDGKKDANKMVQSYFPSARGIKTAQYTLALYIGRDKKLKKTLLFDDKNDPYQLHNLPLAEHSDVVRTLYKKMAVLLKEIDDPWYKERILSELIPY